MHRCNDVTHIDARIPVPLYSPIALLYNFCVALKKLSKV